MRFLNNIESGAAPAFSLPLTDGSNGQVLKTNGSGVVTWQDDTAGTDTNYYVSAAAFNTSNGELTLTVSGGGSNVVVDLDGRYLTSYTDTNTTYDLAVTAGAANTSVIELTGSDSSTDSVTLSGGSNITITESGNTITIAATDTDTTYTASDGVTLTGTNFTHTDTSSVSDLTASARTYVTGLTFDTFGHVTGVSTGTETVVNTDTNTTYTMSIPVSTTNLVLDASSGTDSTVTFTGSGATTVTRTSATEFTISSTDTNTDTNTTYSTSIPSSTTKLRLTGSDSSTDDIEFVGAGATTVTRTDASTFTISSTDTNTDTNTTYDLTVPASTTAIRLAAGGSGSGNDDITISGGGATTVTRVSATELQISSTDTNTDTNTTYSLGVGAGASNSSTIDLTAGGSGSGTDSVTIAGGTNVTVTESGNTITIAAAGGTDTNYYVDGLTFATGTGILTASVNGATNQTVDLDGRYYELGIGSAEENVIATYSSGNVMDFATEGNNSIGNQRLMSDGSEVGIWNRNWTNKADGGAGALYYWSVAPEQATSRAAIGSNECMSIKANIAADIYAGFRQANTSYDMHLATRSEQDTGLDMFSGASGAGAYKTARINSNVSGQLEIINYGTNPFHMATGRTDANFSWYHGDATTAGGIASLTNPKANLNMKLQGILGGTAQLLVNGSNSASTPDYSFIDDTDTGFYYEGTAGNVSFATGGTKTFRFPTTTGTSGQVLQTDGSGNTSWATAGGGGSGTVNSGGAGQVAFYAAAGTAVSGDAGMTYNASTDTLTLVGDVIAYASSDERFKDNIKPIPNALEKISKISGYTYDWNETAESVVGRTGSDVGVIAQEVEEVLPEVVKTRENGYKAVNYEKMVALLIEANKELQDVVAQLEERIIDLENK